MQISCKHGVQENGFAVVIKHMQVSQFLIVYSWKTGKAPSDRASTPLSVKDFQYTGRSKYSYGCTLEQTLLLHMLCCVHSGIWYFTLGIRCVWGCGELQTNVRISSLASLTGFPRLADLLHKHLPCFPSKVNDSQQMCCFVCKAS